MDDLSQRILNQFLEFGEKSLDLHALLEAAGNDPGERDRVVDAVERLARAGLVQELGSDFYALTDKGRDAIKKV
jgi:hypothetical protein